MKIFVDSETNPILRASQLEPKPLCEPVQHEPITVFENGPIAVEQVSTKRGPYNTLRFGETNKGVVTLIHRDGQILLIRKPRYAIQAVAWEAPRVTCEPEETYLQAALRHANKIANTHIIPERVTCLGTIHADSGLLSTQIRAYFINVSGLGTTDSQLAEQEDENIQYFDISDIQTALEQGFIPCSLTTTAFFRAKGRNLL